MDCQDNQENQERKEYLVEKEDLDCQVKRESLVRREVMDYLDYPELKVDLVNPVWLVNLVYQYRVHLDDQVPLVLPVKRENLVLLDLTENRDLQVQREISDQ